jgi:hypothetical protein
MNTAKRLTLAALLGLSLIPLRLATAQSGEIGATLTILAPSPGGSQVKTTTTTCSGNTCTQTTVIVVN